MDSFRVRLGWLLLCIFMSTAAARGSVVEVLGPLFTMDSRDFTVTTQVMGTGSVVRDPDKGSYVWGEVLWLHAQAGTGHRFDGWGGSASGTVNPLEVPIAGLQHRTVSASFARDVPAPQWLRATHGDYPDRIEVDWGEVPGVSRYELRRGRSVDGAGANIIAQLPAGTIYYDDEGANPGVAYYYWVRSVEGRDRSAYVGPVQGMRRDDTRPPVPEGLRTIQGLWPDKVQLNWDPVGVAQSYDIFRSVRPLEATATALQTGWIPPEYFDEAPVGWTFYYWISARDGLGVTSPWAGPVRGRAGRSVTWWGSEIVELEMPDSYADAIQIELGLRHGLALSPTGTVGAWGSNFYGQATVPPGVLGAVAVAAGYNHSLVLLDDSTVVGWGHDDKGQASGGAGVRNLVAISAGEAFSLGLDARGRVHAWGDNSHGQLNVLRHLPPAVAIAAGGSHGLALLANGTVAAWGSNSHGQADVPAGLRNVQAIAAGARHSLALLENGTVRGWGDNTNGQAPAHWDPNMQTHGGDLQPMSGPSNVVSIAAGLFHSVALLANGQVTTMSGGGSGAPAENTHNATLAAGDNYSTALRREGEPAAVWIVPSQLEAPEGAGALLRAQSLATGSRSYQWKHRGQAIPGETRSVLRLNAVRGADVGEYTVEVSNVAGRLESEPAHLELGAGNLVAEYFADYYAMGEDWGQAPWFGMFYHGAFPWIYTERFGWLWCAGWGGESVLFYRPGNAGSGQPSGWIESTPAHYPHYYDYREGRWVAFEF